MTTYILVIWTIVGVANYTRISDWRPIGEFHGRELCEDAGKRLDKTYMCLRSKGKP